MFSTVRQFRVVCQSLWLPDADSVTFGGTFITNNETIAQKGWILDNGATPSNKVNLTGGVGAFGGHSIIISDSPEHAAAGVETWADTTLMDNIRGGGALEVMPASQHWTS